MDNLDYSLIELINLKKIKIMPVIEELLKELHNSGIEICFSVTDDGSLYTPNGNTKKIKYKYKITKNGVRIRSFDDLTICENNCSLKEFVELALNNKYVLKKLYKAFKKQSYFLSI